MLSRENGNSSHETAAYLGLGATLLRVCPFVGFWRTAATPAGRCPVLPPGRASGAACRPLRQADPGRPADAGQVRPLHPDSGQHESGVHPGYGLTPLPDGAVPSFPGKEFYPSGMGNQTITFASLTASSRAESPVTLVATASSGLVVTFASSDSSVASISGTTVTLHKARFATITASQAGNETWQAAPDVT